MAFEYAPAPESRSIVDIQSSYSLYIGGAWTEPKAGGSRKTVNPATEEVLAEVAEADESDVDAAVAAARARSRTCSPRGWQGLSEPCRSVQSRVK